MNKEIKEIINKIEATFETTENNSYIKFKWLDYKCLLDYITNLQEENKRLRELDENYPIEEQLEETIKYKNIYKSRIDKAIEYIKENACYSIQEKCCLDDLSYNECDKLLEILKGEDKDE